MNLVSKRSNQRKMNRNKVLLLIAIFAAFTLNVRGQNQPKKLEIGFNVNQFQNDYGVGVHLISPYFLHSKVAVRAGANLQWFEYFSGTETTWSPYQNFQLGLRARSEILENKIFIYGEGGIVTILPNSDFSNESLEFGGYGVFGFEFKSISKFAYYIELGGVGTGAVADKLVNKPIYSNGFLINVGLRVEL